MRKATRKEQEAHDAMRHSANHQTGECLIGPCQWGYSNPKHGDHGGGHGRAGKRKQRGLQKGWYKELVKLVGPNPRTWPTMNMRTAGREDRKK